jgi:hypothetical protein
MDNWQVVLQDFPAKKIESFYRICRKHDRRFTDEQIIERLTGFIAARSEDPKQVNKPSLIVAQYPVKEACENVVAEITNLSGTAVVEAVVENPQADTPDAS